MFNKILHVVEQNYVEPVEGSKLIDGAIKGMLESLDPHTAFLDKETYKEMQIDTRGRFGGLGIEIFMQTGVLSVITPMEETPAWDAGVQAGDKIIKIDGKSTRGLSLQECVNRMRGKPGTKVTITVWRDSFEEPKDFTITRAEIKEISARGAELLPGGFGYVRLTQFKERTARELKEAVAKMEKENKKPLSGLILDLRNNPGGLLDQAVEVSNFFIDSGKIVSTRGRNAEQEEVRMARKEGARMDFPLAVLVNTASASASEIVAGAIQDNKRGVIIGQPTFGKGSVQTIIPLEDDTALKLTIARYYTPSGRSIQSYGIQPDMLVDEVDPELYAKSVIKKNLYYRERDLDRHLKNELGEDEEAKKTDDGKKDDKASTEYTKEELTGKKDDKKPVAPKKVDPKSDLWTQIAIGVLKGGKAAPAAAK